MLLASLSHQHLSVFCVELSLLTKSTQTPFSEECVYILVSIKLQDMMFTWAVTNLMRDIFIYMVVTGCRFLIILISHCLSRYVFLNEKDRNLDKAADVL